MIIEAPFARSEYKQNDNFSGRDYEDYGFDDSTPSPNYNPGTPGGGSGTPGGQGSGYSQESPANPYTPQTPGSVYNPQDGYSPYQPSPSPTGGYQCKQYIENIISRTLD